MHIILIIIEIIVNMNSNHMSDSSWPLYIDYLINSLQQFYEELLPFSFYIT